MRDGHVSSGYAGHGEVKVNHDPASEAEITQLREQLAEGRKANRPRARLPEEFLEGSGGVGTLGLYRIALGVWRRIAAPSGYLPSKMDA